MKLSDVLAEGAQYTVNLRHVSTTIRRRGRKEDPGSFTQLHDQPLICPPPLHPAVFASRPTVSYCSS